MDGVEFEMTTDKTALDALLPCPFCEAKIIFIERKFFKMDCPDAEMEEQAKAVCNSCGISTQFCYETNCFSAEQNARTAWNTRPQPSGDAVQVWCVYKSEDDSHHIFSTKENAEIFANSTTEPIVIYDYIIDHPERYYERTN